MDDLDAKNMVSQINVESGVCTGWPIIVEDIRKEITINMASAVLRHVQEKKKGRVKVTGDALLQKSVNITVENCKDESFQRNFRRGQRRTEICSCIKQTFVSRSHKRSFDMGDLNLEVDLDTFEINLNQSTVEYSYKNDNLACLDTLLGKRWDLSKGQLSCHFVTSLRV